MAQISGGYMKTPVNRRTLKQHMTYNWWKYILFLVIGIFGVDLLYTVTAPRIPDDKKVDLYISGYVDTEKLEEYTEKVRSEEMPWLEKIQQVTLYTDDQYGPMQLMTYIAAGEGDIYLLPRENFLSLSSEGAFIPLENDPELMQILSSIDLQRGWRKNTETGENHLYGIPQDKLPGLIQYAYCSNGFLSVHFTNKNEENALAFLRILCRDMLQGGNAERPDGNP